MVILLLTRFSPISALLTVLVVSLQTVLGESVIGRFTGFNQISRMSKVGLGFCIGATVSTSFYVFVVTFAGTMAAVISQFMLLVLAVLLRLSQISSTDVQATSDELGAVNWLAVITLLGMAPNWFWPLPVAIWLATLFLVWPRLKNGFGSLKLIVALIFGASGGLIWVQIIGTRPDRAWFADDRFAELFSFSLGKWGVSHNPMLVSESISYHWFSFAWIGVVSNLAFSKVDVVFAHFGPAILALACAVLGFAVIKTFTRNTTVALVSLACAVFVDTERLFEGYGFNAFQMSSFSQFFSLALGLALLLIIVAVADEQLSSVVVIVGIIFAALIGAKISSGLVVGFGLGGVWLFGLFRQRKIRESLKFLTIGLIVPGLCSLIVFYGDPRNGSTDVIRRPGWVVGVSRDLWHVYNGNLLRYLPILIFSTLAFGGLGFIGLLVTLRTKVATSRFRNIQAFFIFALLASLSQMLSRGSTGGTDDEGNVNTLYAFHFWISLIRFVAIALVVQRFIVLWRAQKLRKTILVIGFFYLIAIFMARSWEINYESSYIIPLLTTFKHTIPLFLALLLAGLLSVFIRVKRQSLGFQSIPQSVLALSSVALIAIGLLMSFMNYDAVSSRQQREWRSMDVEYSVSSDFAAATNWLRFNMRRDDVVATKATRSSPRVALLTGHKDFAGTPMSFRIFGEHSSDYAQNYKLVDQFVKNGSCDSAKDLREFEVNFFLVDLANLDTPDVLRCADEVFRNKGSVVYKIK